jgi:hypothetical protein
MRTICKHCGSEERREEGDCPAGHWWWVCSNCGRKWEPIDTENTAFECSALKQVGLPMDYVPRDENEAYKIMSQALED